MKNKTYDEYYETWRDDQEIAGLLLSYWNWCKENRQQPEVRTIENVNSSNLGHVAYHAEIYDNQQIEKYYKDLWNKIRNEGIQEGQKFSLHMRNQAFKTKYQEGFDDGNAEKFGITVEQDEQGDALDVYLVITDLTAPVIRDSDALLNKFDLSDLDLLGTILEITEPDSALLSPVNRSTWLEIQAIYKDRKENEKE